MKNYLKNRNSKEEWVYRDNKVGLSKEPNLTASINCKEYYNGEGIITFEMPNYEGKPKQTPPKRNKKLKSNALTKEAKSKIKRVCRMFDYYVKNLKGKSKKCSMITLSYPKNYPDDRTAKQHLDNFLKRINRYSSDFMYVWVAEKQKRGAIHFHIITPNFIPKGIINSGWTEIVRKWYQKNGYTFSHVLPNVKAVDNVSRYVTKYITKDENNTIEGNRYNISKCAHELAKPKRTELLLTYSRNPIELVLDTASSLKAEIFQIDNSDTKKEENPTLIFGYFIPNARGLLEKLKSHPKVYKERKLSKIGTQLYLIKPSLY
jgi:hypothetical protein